MSKITVGKDVLSYCGKCKLSLSHTIMAMKNENTIAKVQCNTCKASHAYKDPAKQGKKIKTRSIIPGAKSKSVSVQELWTDEIRKASGKARAYGIRETFVVGELLDHKKFGPGIVQQIVDGKIEVLFQNEIKTLIHSISK